MLFYACSNSKCLELTVHLMMLALIASLPGTSSPSYVSLGMRLPSHTLKMRGKSWETQMNTQLESFVVNVTTSKANSGNIGHFVAGVLDCVISCSL